MQLRSEVKKEYTWDLSKFYESDKAWYADAEKLKKYIPALKKYKGKLNNPNVLLEFLELDKECNLLLERLYMYASNNLNVQLDSKVYNEMSNQLVSTASVISEETSFFNPELVSYGKEYLQQLIKDKRFANHKFDFSELIRQQKHVLSEKEEKLLSGVAAFSGDTSDIFDSLTDVDFVFNKAIDSEGKEHEVTDSTVSVLLKSKDRALRKSAYESYYGKYKDFNNTITVNFISNLKSDLFFAKARKFDSVLQVSLFAQNISKKLFQKLNEETLKNVKLLNKYYEIRKKMLGLSELNFYDLSVSLCENYEKKYSIEEGEKLVLEALAPLGEEYVNTVKFGFEHRWIDVFPTKGKRSGGYETGAYGFTPVVLLNYTEEINEVFTIAHEMGHAMHTYYAHNSQPYETCDYTIFLAEIASTFNEVLLNKFLFKNAQSKEEKIYFLDRFIKLFVGTVFTQMQYSNFEEYAHGLVQKNEPISKEILNKKYYELNSVYAAGVKNDELKSYHWSIVPHFYRSFYVFKYATGLIASICLASKVLNNEPNALKKYFAFLSAGGSDFSTKILKNAGVNLETNEPYEIAFGELKWAIKELEKLNK